MNVPERMSSLHRSRTEYDRHAEAYDGRWTEYLRLTSELLLRLLDSAPDGRLLDAGCGTGALLRQISQRWPGVPLVGIDPSGGMLRRAVQRLGARSRFVQGDVTALPLADQSFSIVVSTSSLRYWANAEAGIREIARVLEPGGRLILLDWCGDALRHRLLARWLRLTGRVAGHLHGRVELQQMLAKCGFSSEVECIQADWYWRLILARATLSSRCAVGTNM